MITAVFTSGFDHTELSGLWQWDYGQKLRIQGLNLPPAVEIHFSLSKSGGDSESRVGVTRDGVTDVPIPDSMLENGGTIQNYYIYAFIYLTDKDSGKTVKWIQLHVNSRPKPEAFDSPEEAELFREAIAAVNESAGRAETAQRAVEEAKEQVANDKEEVFLAKTAVEESEKNVIENKEYVRQTVENFTSFAENAVDYVNVAGQNQVNNIEEAGQAALDNISNGVDESLTQSGKAADAKKTGERIDELKGDLSNKITKFYASSQGETHLIDSDNGKIMDMMIYGKSSQDGTPSHENPVEIKNVVNPTVKVRGKNLLNATLQTTTSKGVTCTANGDGTYTLNGTATSNADFWVIGEYNNNINIPLNPTKKYVLKGTGCIHIQIHTGTANKVLVSEHGKDITLTNMAGLAFVLLRIDGGFTANNIIIYPQIEEGFTSTTYEPYHDEQTVTLPYTLNAIPVESGGNVTIDGQQYISDYVDVERKKLVRYVGKDIYDGDSKIIGKLENSYGKRFQFSISSKAKTNSSSKIILLSSMDWDYVKTIGFNSNYTDGKDYGYVNENSFLFSTNRFNSNSELLEYLSQSPITIMYPLATPTEIDLTDEEVQAFKALATHYPVTNISVNSEQLDGYTVFNYPISMANGWNYVKQQLNDNRDYIYDMDTRTQDMDIQAAEAYVNSEYAVALTELEV